MSSYMQHVQRALQNVTIHSCKQNDKGWDNVAIIINQEWLFRFPRKLEYAKKYPVKNNYARYFLNPYKI